MQLILSFVVMTNPKPNEMSQADFLKLETYEHISCPLLWVHDKCMNNQIKYNSQRVHVF